MRIYKYKFLLEKILKCTEGEVRLLIENKKEMYEYFTISKKNGKREICGLKSEGEGKKFIRIQKCLYKKFFCKIPVSVQAKGFISGEDYHSFLKPHIGMKYFMRIDIKNFFGSFSEQMIKQNLSEYITDQEALDTVLELCTLEGRLPQGAITSPMLSNIIFKRVDQRILKYCQKIDEYCMEENRNIKGYRGKICYTRYADDMLFSSDFFDFSEKIYFYHMISKILKDNGFQINKEKTIISKNELALNGYVIGENLHLSRKRLQNLRKILYIFRKENTDRYLLDECKFKNFRDTLQKINSLGIEDRNEKRTFTNIQELIFYLSGYRSWIVSVLRLGDDTTQRQSRDLQKLIRRIEKVLEELHKVEVCYGGRKAESVLVDRNERCS